MRNSFVQSQMVVILAIISASSLIGSLQGNAQGRAPTRQESIPSTRKAREQLSLDIAIVGASSLIGSSQASAQGKAPTRQESTASTRKAREQRSLDIYNFVPATRGSGPDSNEGVSQALGDALLLQFVGQPRFLVRRIRESYSVSASAQQKSTLPSQNQQPLSKGPTRYVLNGTVGVFEPPNSMAPGSERSNPSHFVIIKYWLRAVGGQREPELVLDGDETPALSLLPIAVKHISDRILLKLVPPTRIRLRTEPVQLSGFPEERKSFYLENLTELLQAELQSVDWIVLVAGESPAEYSVQETASLYQGKYELNAKMLAIGRDEAAVSFPQSGLEQDILAGQFRVARQILEELDTRQALVASGSNPADADTDAATLLMAAKGYDETDPDLALPLYRRAVALDPTSLEAKLYLAKALIHEQHAQEALKVLEGPEIEKSAMGHFLRSAAHAFLFQWEEAVSEADHAVELAPTARTFWWRGRMKTFKKDSKGALPDYQKALSLDPGDPDYYEAVARAQEDLKDYTNAVKVLEEGRKRATDGEKLAPLQNSIRRDAALALLQSGQPGKALPFAQAAAAEEPKSEVSQRILGTAYHALARLPEAETTLAKALALEETPESLAEMAWVYFDQHRKASAHSFAVKSIVKDPDGALAYQMLTASVGTEAQAMQTVKFLSSIWRDHPRSFRALEAWDFLQLIYLAEDQAGLKLLDSAYTSTLKTVSYKDWLEGWSNMVELALVSGRADQAAAIASDLLKAEPSLDYAVTMQFYLWLALVAHQQCAEDAWNAFANLLSRPEVDGLNTHWDFTATRGFLYKAAHAGAIDERTRLKADSAINLLSAPLGRAQIDRFLLMYPANKNQACP